MLNTQFPPWPSYSEDEAESVKQLVLSNRVNYWTGQNVKDFEREFAEYIGTEYSVAVTNGSVALELALKACGLSEGDEVVVSPRSFIASVSSVILAGGRPVFAEIDEDTQAIYADSIKAVLTPHTKVIVVVHLGGTPADMDPIMALAKEHNLIVIEDCAQAHGASYKGRRVGSIGHLGSWSFCQDKIMSTGGEGGMVTTDNPHYWSKMWSYKDHGKSWHAVQEASHGSSYRWLHGSFGTNWRMLEMQAILGRIQLKLLDSWVQTRKKYALEIYKTARNCHALRIPVQQDDVDSVFYKCYLFLKPERLKAGMTRDTVVNMINEQGVPCYVGACPEIYLESAFDNTDFRPKTRFEVAKKLGETSLMFLVHPTLEEQHIKTTCKVLNDVLDACSLPIKETSL